MTRGGSERVVRGQAARLLATLALEPGRAWSIDDLGLRLWPDGPPATARTAIQGHVSRLRQALPDVDRVRIETVAGGYALHAARANVDVTRFADLVAQARDDLAAGDPESASAQLRTALALWTGAALGDPGSDDPLAADAAALEEARRDAEEHLADALIEAGDLPAALSLAGRLVKEDPLREHRWWQLVVALARSGRQADALRACRQATRTIVDRTGLDPGPELRRLEMAILVQDPLLETRRWTPAPGSAPVPLVALVGRDEEQAALADRLHAARMVTVVGLGGVGKTTLATAVAADEAARHADGAVVVDLADGGPDDVGRTIAAAFGAAPVSSEGGGTDDHVTRAVTAVEGRDVLIVLDNCEQVANAAAAAAMRLLRAGPEVRVLATSQTALGVPGESVVGLQPLAVPRPDAEPEAIRRTPAGQLLARRLAEQGCPILDETGWRAVGTLARTLDGLPLALEIVAAAARTEPLGPLARRIADDAAAVLDVDVLRPGHRRSLRAALDAAVAPLDPLVADLFAAMGVLPGEIGVDLAAVLADTDTSTARGALRTLADASLAVIDAGGHGLRARLLSPVRAYARHLLDPASEKVVMDRLARWCIDVAAELAATGSGPDQDAGIERFVAELPPLRVGLRHLIDSGRIAEAAVAFEGLVSRWADSAAGPEAAGWADELLRYADQLEPGPRSHLGVAAVRCQFAFDMIADHLPVAERALADAQVAGDDLMAAGARISVAIGLGWRAIDLDRAARLLDESRTMFLDFGEAHWAAVAREFQGLLALRRLDVVTGLARLEEALAEHRRIGAPGDIAHALTFIGFARRLLDDPAGARRAFDEARRLIGRTRVATWLRATEGAGFAALALGDTDGAGAAFRDAHRRATEVSDRRIASTALVGLASIARVEGDDQREVALLLAAAEQALDGGDPADAVTAAVGLARVLSASGHDDEAAVLLGAAQEIPTSAEVRVHFGLAEDPEPVRRTLQRRLGADDYARLVADGALIGLPAGLARAGERLLDTDPVRIGPGDLRLVG
jgi:predicted ATPase/DNA-binding SARP family transcriptional activator